ncbi:MAG: family 20 glycosylhydrolase [Anaerolineae bacterium]|nr:family 20 glycosylhydrolase [Anaerolineae bacterium]
MSKTAPILLPEPRQMRLTGGTLKLSDSKFIVIPSPAFLFEGEEAQRVLSEYADVTWHLYAAPNLAPEQMGLHIAVNAGAAAGANQTDSERQAYTLDITANGIRIHAFGQAGAFYGVMTLAQLLRQYGNKLPQLHIKDHPDFASRGIMLDISRDKVPTMKTLFELVDRLALMKQNELQLYTEHTFAFQKHPVVWAKASPMTGEEIMQLDAYCQKRHIKLVPNQNTFGHMRRWLTHDEYRPLSEAPNGCQTKWGYFAEPFTLNPIDPGSIALVGDMLGELLPHFSSNVINVGCDETVDLGQGASKEMVEEIGVGRTYLEFLTKINKLTRQHGKVMQFWGDIIMEHPELVPHLPKDVIALEWGYEHDHPFDEHGAKFAASGVPFYVCPGTSTWNTLGGRTTNAIGNLLNAAEAGLKHGAIGYLNTDWGDNGHLQPLPVSYLGYGYGAGVSWCLASNRNADIASAISLHLFDDASGKLGKLAYAVGDVYLLAPDRTFNATAYGRAIFMTQKEVDDARPKFPNNASPRTIKSLRKAIDHLELALSKIKTTNDATSDEQALVKREYAWVLNAMRFGLSKIEGTATPAVQRKLIAEHKKIWLARNREGGLEDSVKNIRL